MNKIIDAARFASIAHAGQRRKYNGDPYIYHPLRVASRAMLLSFDNPEDVVCAAVLHDTIEDGHVTVTDINEGFGEAVAILVVELTNPSKGVTASRAERKQMDRDHLAKVSDEAKIIKMLDRIDNLRELDGAAGDFVSLYCEESKQLLKVVGGAHKVLAKELSDLIDSKSIVKE